LSAEHVVTKAEANVCRDGGDGRNGYDRVHALSAFAGKAAGGGTIPGRSVHGHSAETTCDSRNVTCSYYLHYVGASRQSCTTSSTH
jgi:hypothetical protein